MLLKITFYASNSNQNIYSEKLQKKLLFSNLKNTHSQLSLEKKINVVAILDRSVANFEVNLILASHRLAIHSREFNLFLGPESAHEKHCILSKNDKYKKISFLFELFKNFQKGYKKGYWSALVFHEAQDFPIKSRKMY